MPDTAEPYSPANPAPDGTTEWRRGAPDLPQAAAPPTAPKVVIPRKRRTDKPFTVEPPKKNWTLFVGP